MSSADARSIKGPALRAGIPPFYVMDVWLAAAERQRTHGDLVNLSAGQPSAGAPAAVREAVIAALNMGIALAYLVMATRLAPRLGLPRTGRRRRLRRLSPR